MSLKEKLSQLPENSGVYLMKNSSGKIIYVGKAKNLKNRVRSYFKSEHENYKTRALVEEIEDFDLIITKNEVEALLLERNLIRHNQPRFNILLRDDKEYPYIRVHYGENWPRLQKVRRRKDDGAIYLGPYANAGVLSELLRTCYQVFPLIRCSPHEFRTAKRPCNYYHMNMCLAPCVLKVERFEYIEMIKQAVELLKGQNNEVKKQLKSGMNHAAEALEYEKAARIRDQIYAIEKVQERQIAVIKNHKDIDSIVCIEQENNLFFSVCIIRDTNLIGTENFIVGAGADSLEDAVVSFILQYYVNRPVPQKILLETILEAQTELEMALSQENQSVEMVKILKAKTKEDSDLINIAKANAKLHADQFNQQQLRLRQEVLDLQKSLNLKKIPRIIECIDISNTQATAIVASCVCFIDGKPAKEHYKKFEINSLNGEPNDFASMQEVIRRRFKNLESQEHLPDLLIIDGGKGQLNAVMQEIKKISELGTEIVSLAKSRLSRQAIDIRSQPMRTMERVFKPESELPIELTPGSSSYRIMTRVRDEAHRFAITFHRKKRQEQSHRSALDSIPGLGPKLKQRLFEELGSWKAIQSASYEQLLAIKGIHAKLALTIYTSLQDLVNQDSRE